MSFLLGGQRAANKPPPSLTPKEPVKSAKTAPVKKVEDVVTHQPVAQQPPPQPNANEHHTEPTPGPIPTEQQATAKPKDEKQPTATTKPHQSVFIKEVKLHKNGDATVPPAIYTYHSKEGHSFDEVLGHMGKLVPPKNGQPANALYTHEGQKITNLTQLADVNEDHFVVAHGEYEPVQGGYLKPAAHNLHRDPPKHHTEEPEPTHKEKEPSKQTRPKSSKPQKQTDPPKSNNNDQQSDDKIGVIKRFYVYRCGDPKYKWAKVYKQFPPSLLSGKHQFRAHTYVYRSRHVRSNWDALCEDLTKVAPPIHGGHVVKLFTVDGEEEITHVSQLEPNLDYVACGVDGYVDVHGGYEKIGHRDGTVAKQGAGGRQTPIYRRKDQTNPENIMIYVFRNGQGIDSHMFTYKKKELDKGLPWIKERIGHKLQTNGKRLCTVDGQEVMHTNDLINRGCYILVPAHEKFREDTYYYLPEAAVDTSGDAEEHPADQHQQKQERREKPHESRPKSSKPQRNESAPPSRNQSRAASPSDYQSEYEDSVRSATPVSRYDSDPEDPFPHKHNNKNDSRSAGTSPIRTLAIPHNKHPSRAKTPAGRTRHQSVSPIPSQQYRDPLEPFDHNIPSTKPHRQQQPTPQRNLHPQQQFPQQQYPQQQYPQQQFPQQQYPQQQYPQQQFPQQNFPQQQQQFPPRQQQPNVNRNRPQTAFEDPENEYGNRPEWVNPDKIRSVLEESDPFKNQGKPEPRKKPNEQLPYGRRPVTQQRQPQGQHQQQQQPRPQQTQRQQQPQPQFYPQQQYSDLEPEPVAQPQPLRQPYKPPAPVHKPAPVAHKPAPQKPLATVPKPTPQQPVRRRSDNDVFYAKEPTQLSLRRGPVDLDKDPGGIFKAKKATENPISKPQRQPTGKASLRQPPPAKVNHKDNKYTKDLTAYYY